MNQSRRQVLRAAAAAPILLVLSRMASSADSAKCFDLDSMPASDKSLRSSLGFKAQSSDSNKRCGTCAFFTPSAGDCGKCTLLSGGAVASTSVCESWASKT
jgi:hypothetical protein